MKAACRDLGLMDYKTCWDLQQTMFDALLAQKTGLAETNPAGYKKAAYAAEYTDSESALGTENAPDEVGTILLVEHPAVYTLGKSGHAENLLIDSKQLQKLGAQFYRIDRGGDITFHGPGQLVCYPILDLEKLGIGLREYVESLEEAVIRTVAEFGIQAGRIAGASGVWLGEETVAGTNGFDKRIKGQRSSSRKICAIGVRSSRFVTMHGFALNVSTDLEWFNRINPCGFRDRGVTSIERETGRTVRMDEVKTGIVHFLSEILNVKIYNN